MTPGGQNTGGLPPWMGGGGGMSPGLRAQVQDQYGRSPGDPRYGQPPAPGETVPNPAGRGPGMPLDGWQQTQGTLGAGGGQLTPLSAVGRGQRGGLFGGLFGALGLPFGGGPRLGGFNPMYQGGGGGTVQPQAGWAQGMAAAASQVPGAPPGMKPPGMGGINPGGMYGGGQMMPLSQFAQPWSPPIRPRY